MIKLSKIFKISETKLYATIYTLGNQLTIGNIFINKPTLSKADSAV